MRAAPLSLRLANRVLSAEHYLGPIHRGEGLVVGRTVFVFAQPTSRRLPQDGSWLELVRWCLRGGTNVGSASWAAAAAWLREQHPALSTVVSYSDPGRGHNGALYRASGWLWAPTWHRLRPPPSGNGDWGDGPQGVKDRWVFPLRPDERRVELLGVEDAAVRKAWPGAEYREPAWRYGRRNLATGGGDWKRYAAALGFAPAPRRPIVVGLARWGVTEE